MPITRPAAALLAGLAFLPLIQPAAAADIAVPMPGNTARKVTLYHASAALAVGIGVTANVENAQVLAQGLKERGYNARSMASTDGANLRDLVREFLARDGINPDSRLLLWFSGLTQMAEALPLDELAAMLNMAAARHILVVLDGCSESPAFRWSEPVAGAVDWPALLPGRQVLAHCGSDPRLFRERFLTLLSGASPADTNQDGLLTATEMARALAADPSLSARYGVSTRNALARGDMVVLGGEVAAKAALEHPGVTIQGNTSVNTVGKTANSAAIGQGNAAGAMIGAIAGAAPTPPPPPSAPLAAAPARASAEAKAMPAPHKQRAIILPDAEPVDRERYDHRPANGVVAVAEQPVSTFSIDVDTASYANVRRMLKQAKLPPGDSVRIEELVNYFRYDDPPPAERGQPFRASISLMPTPWNADTLLMRIGLKGYELSAEQRPRANLVFLIDTSGSMGPPDRLPLLKQALRLMVQELKDDDTVGIVTYAGNAGVALEPTPARERDRILTAIESFESGGSTAGGAGIAKAYELARRHFDKTAINRILLATDGDFNVGVTQDERLEEMVARQRDSGIYLSVLGFGMGNYNDAMMQKVAQAGNGNAAYIDTLGEAAKVLVDEMSSTVFPIANDVKIQVEFNPARIAEYRLIGYESRMLKREDFSNDKVDAGDIGAGHSVTALYEITPVGSKARKVEPLRYQQKPEKAQPAAAATGEYAFLRLRYKLPGEKESKLMEMPVTEAELYREAGQAPAELRFSAAVAGFGQVLRGDPYLKGFGFNEALALAQGARGEDPFGYRAEFVQLVRLATKIKR